MSEVPNESVHLALTSCPYGCYSEDTEVLTLHGWKLIKDVSIGEYILTLEPITKTIMWQKASSVFAYDFSGDMVAFKNCNIDLLVTPNHGMYIEGNKMVKDNFGIFIGSEPIYRREAKDITTADKLPLNGFRWEGKKEDCFVLPSYEKSWVLFSGGKRCKKWAPLRIPMHDWLRFFGFWLAEGSTCGSKGGSDQGGRVEITQITYKDYARDVLSALPFKFNENGKRFSISNRQLWAYLRQFGNSHEKYIPEEIKNLCAEQLHELFESYMVGDGHVGGRCFGRSVSKRLQDDLQEISIKMGYTAHINTEGKVFFNVSEKVTLYACMSKQPYTGKVYCLEVPNHVIYVRRNRVAVFCGNSIKDYGHPDQIGYYDSLPEYYRKLGNVWSECVRALHPGGRMCINIGDQYVRASKEVPYQILPLHAHLVSDIMAHHGTTLVYLGSIIWQKIPTTKTTGGASVMGSYPYPRNGYVSYNFEYIAIFKKLGKDPRPSREIKAQSVMTKEEWRDLFNGIWRFNGVRQIDHIAIFPDELPRRLIKMFTFPGDTVLDPFLGSGTTTKKAYEMGRNSIGYEIGFGPSLESAKEIIKRKIHFYDVPLEQRASIFPTLI